MIGRFVMDFIAEEVNVILEGVFKKLVLFIFVLLCADLSVMLGYVCHQFH